VAHIAAAQLVELDADIGNGTIRVGVREFISAPVTLADADGRNLICELSANPKIDKESMRLYWVSDNELLQRVWRFDKPPNFGGKKAGIVRAVVGMLAFAGVGFGIVILGILKSIQHPFGYVVYEPVTLIAAGVVWFFVASGIRGMYYYFRMPPELRK
jgi:hypothetical protein